MSTAEFTTLDPRWQRAPWPARQAYLASFKGPRPADVPANRENVGGPTKRGNASRAKVAAILATNPDATAHELAAAMGCHITTASKHLKRIDLEASE